MLLSVLIVGIKNSIKKYFRYFLIEKKLDKDFNIDYLYIKFIL